MASVQAANDSAFWSVDTKENVLYNVTEAMKRGDSGISTALDRQTVFGGEWFRQVPVHYQDRQLRDASELSKRNSVSGLVWYLQAVLTASGASKFVRGEVGGLHDAGDVIESFEEAFGGLFGAVHGCVPHGGWLQGPR